MITFVDRHIVSSRNYGSPKVMMAAVRRGKSVGRCGGHVEAASAHPFGRAEQSDSSPTARRSAPRRLPNPVQGYLMRFSLPVSRRCRECIKTAPALACHLSCCREHQLRKTFAVQLSFPSQFQRLHFLPVFHPSSRGYTERNGFVTATKLGKLIFFVFLQPKILLQQPNVFLIELNNLL